jgi:hypothetical protein
MVRSSRRLADALASHGGQATTLARAAGGATRRVTHSRHPCTRHRSVRHCRTNRSASARADCSSRRARTTTLRLIEHQVDSLLLGFSNHRLQGARSIADFHRPVYTARLSIQLTAATADAIMRAHSPLVGSWGSAGAWWGCRREPSHENHRPLLNAERHAAGRGATNKT